MSRLCISVIFILAGQAFIAADDKTSLPGKASWDLAAFGTIFKVAETRYDEETKQVTWVLELKNEVRTADLVRDLDERVYQLTFTDEDGKELAITQMRASKFKGIPTGEKFAKRGTKL